MKFKVIGPDENTKGGNIDREKRNPMTSTGPLFGRRGTRGA